MTHCERAQGPVTAREAETRREQSPRRRVTSECVARVRNQVFVHFLGGERWEPAGFLIRT